MGPVGARPGTGRRGEEAFVARAVALGMPTLRTIHDSGLFEGGSLAFPNERTAVVGLSYRQNDREARKGKPVPSDHAPLVIDLDGPGFALDAGWTDAEGRIARRIRAT
jgi:hypothetical protein